MHLKIVGIKGYVQIKFDLKINLPIKPKMDTLLPQINRKSLFQNRNIEPIRLSTVKNGIHYVRSQQGQSQHPGHISPISALLLRQLGYGSCTRLSYTR
jgi:hypothetical protein